MALSGTFTLNANYVIIEPIEQTIVIPISNAAIGTIVEVGSDVAVWNVDDDVFYKNSDSAQFKNNNDTWAVVDQSNIYFKYESPA